jgi:two-component system chemotaxis response regulator CheY
MARILAVDDSEPMRQLVLQTLKTAGHDVLLGVDGQNALEIFAAEKFDLVITDINMPGMDGIELVRQIRARDTEIPILALTTEGDESFRRRGEEAGVDGWIVKPFKPAQFIAIVKQILA